MPDRTIDELASATGTTTRSVRSFQTLGLLPHPELRGRTGMYGLRHLQRLRTVLRLQAEGFSLQSLAVLFAAHERGESLGDLLGPATGIRPNEPAASPDMDEAERYGFDELQRNRDRRRGRPLLALLPTTVWDETQAS